MPKQTSLKRELLRRTHRLVRSRVFFAAWRSIRIRRFARVYKKQRLLLFAPVVFYTRARGHVAARGVGQGRIGRRAVVIIMGLAVVASLGVGLVKPLHTTAAVSDNINFQARLENTAGAISGDGNYNVEFKLYNAATGGSALWTEDYLNSASQGVRVVNGYLTVNLGSVTAFPSTIAWDQSLYITMNIGGTTSGSPTWDGEMSPRLKLTAVPYAFQAKSAERLQVVSSGNVGTLSFTAPTTTDNILLPDASGTLCLDNSSACGFAAASGSNAYIQNGSGLQANANFNIQTTSTGAITATLRALSGQTADLLRFENSGGTAALSGFNSSGQLYYQAGSFTGTIVQNSLAQNTTYHLPDPGSASDTFCLLSAANCTGTGGGIAGSGTQNRITKFDTAGGNHIGDSSLFDNGSFVGLGTTTNNGLLSVVGSNVSQAGIFVQPAASATVPAVLIKGGATPGTGGSLLDFQDSTGALLATVASDGSVLTGGKAVVGSTTTPTGTTGQLTVVAAGGANVGAVVRAGASQTGALLQLQDSSGNVNAVFSALGNQLTLGRIAGSGTVTQGKLVLGDGTTDNFGVTLQSATLTANSVLTLPNAGGNDTVCLLTLANCTGTGGGIAGSGTQNYIAKFDTLGGNHIGSASLFDNGSFVGLGTTTNSGLLSILGTSASQSPLFAQAAASATTPVALIKGGAAPGSGGDLLDLQTSGSSVVASFDASGNFLTTGSATVNSGLTVSGGATITGGTAINISGTANTSIGNSGGNFSLISTGLNVTNAGALSGITGYSQSGGNFAISSTGTFGTGTGAVSLNGNTTVTGSNTLTVNSGATILGGTLGVTALTTLSGGLTVANTGNVAFQKGSDYSTTGTTNDINLGTGALFRLTGASAQTITGISGGADGRLITIVNAASQAATLSNQNAGSTAANRIITGTGANLSLASDTSVKLVYDSTTSRWRVVGSVGGTTVNTIGTIDSQSKGANGAVITGNSLVLQSADASFPGLVTTGVQTFGGDKTFSGNTTFNGNVSIGGTNTFTTGSGTVTLGSLGAGLVQSSSGGVLSSGVVDRNSSALFNTALTVPNGGTGAGSFTSNGVLFGNGTGTLQVTTAGTSAQLLLANGSGVPTFTTLSGDTTITSAGSLTVNKLQGNTLTVTGPGTGQYLRYNGSAFVNSALQASDITGTLFTLAASSGTSQNVSQGQTVSILAGSSNNLTTTASNTNKLTVDIVGNPTFAGLVTANGGLTVAGSAAFQRGTDFSTTGTSNDVAFGAGSLIRLTGSSAQTITGIAGGIDGRLLTLVNAGTTTATISNNSASSAAVNRITTGTGGNISLPAGASMKLVYDAGASLWRVVGGVVGNSVGSIGTLDSQTKSANGAVITGSSLVLQSADVSFPGLVTTGVQTLAGDKTLTGVTTFSGNVSITGTNTLTTGTGTVTLGSLGTGLVQSSSAGVLSSSAVDRNSSTFFSNALNVANGGTGLTSTTAFGLLAGGTTGTGNLQNVGTGTSGQILQSAGNAALPTWANATAANTCSDCLIQNPLTTARNTIAPTTNSIVGLTVKGTTGTAADVLDIYNSAATPTLQAFFDSAGALNVSQIIHPTANNSIDLGLSGTAFRTGYFGTSVLTPLLDTPSGTATLNIGTTNATSGINLNQNTSITGTKTLSVGGLATLSGGLTVKGGAGTDNGDGTTFTNNNATLNTAKSLGNLSSGAIGSAASTVDIATTFNIAQTTNSQSFTIPGPTSSTAGRLIYINNTGTVSFTIGSVTLAPGASATYIWNGSAWVALTTGSSSSGVSTIGTIDTPSKSADGAHISGNTLYLQSADASFPGLVTTGTQTFAGDKTFNGDVVLGGSGTGLTVANNASISGTFGVTGVTTLSSTLGVTGLTTLSGGLTVTNGGNIAFQKGNDYSTTGSTNDVNLGTGALFRLTGSSVQTITGIAGGADGRIITLVNAAAQAATLTNQNAGSTAANRIITGTGADLTLAPDTSVKLVYDSTTSRWRVESSVGGTTVTTIGTIDSTPTAANGARISGNSLILQYGDASFPGLVSTTTQTFAGAKTFSSDASFTGAGTSLSVTNSATIGNGLTVSAGGATITGNSTITGTLSGLTGLSSSGTITFSGLGAGLVQSSSGGVLSSGVVDRNSSTFFNTALTVANGGTGAGLFTSNGVVFGNGTGALQVTSAGTGGQLLLANASGVPTFTTLGGDTTVTSGGSLTINKLQGNTLTITSPATGQYLRYNGSAFVNSALNASDLTGTLFTLAASSGTSQNVSQGQTVSILAGSSNNLTTTASNTNNVTVDIISNPTFSGKITGSSGTTGLALTGAPVAGSGATSLLQLGSVINGGNSATNGGTYLGINEPASGNPGAAADFVNFQNNNTSRLLVTSAGALTEAGALTVQSGGASITGNSTITGTLSGLTGLTSSGTVTFSGLSTAGVVHTSTAGVLSTGAVALGTDTSGNYVDHIGAVTGLTIGGTNNVASAIPTLAVNYGSAANTAVQGNTTLTCNSGTGNLSGGGNVITLGTGGTCSGITIVNNPTFTGLITGSSNTTGLALTGTPAASATSALEQLGGSITGGNSATNGGTYLSISEPGSGAGTVADFVNFQNSGATKLQVTSTGTLTEAGALTVQSGGATITGNSTITGTLSGLTGLSSSGTITFSGLGAGLVQSSSGGVLSSGVVDRNSSTFFNTALNVGNGGTGTTTTPTNGQLLIGNGASYTVASLGTTGLTATTGAGSLSLAVNYGSAANTAVQGNTTLTCASGTGNLTGGGNTITLGTGGTCNGITIVNNPTFSGLVTANGGLTVATGSTFTNASSSLLTAKLVTDPTSGDFSSAGSSVDVATTFNISESLSSQALTIPAPTLNTAGRVIYINSIGSQGFTIGSVTLAPGASATFIWNGSAWVALTTGSSVSGVTTIGTFDTAPNTSADGAHISGNTLYLQSASATVPGLVNFGSQIFGGAKTFNGDVAFGGAGTGLSVTNAATIGNGLTVTAGGATITAGDLALTGGNLTTAGVQRLTNAGALQNITGYTQSSGNFDASSSSGTFKTSTGAVSLSGNTTVTGSNTLTVNSGATSLGGTLGVTGLTTLNGGLTVKGGAGTDNGDGTTFTNNNATLNTAKNLGNLSSGSIGTAANTVDVATTLNIAQTTAAQAFTIPSPTSTTAGRLIYINNTGTADFTITSTNNGTITVPAKQGRTFQWSGASGAWNIVDNTLAGTGLTQSGNTINSAAPTSVVNDTNIQGSIASNVLTLSWAGTLSVARGGTGAGSFTSNGIVYGNSTGALQVTAAGTQGQLLFAGSGGTPAFTTVSGDITSSSSTTGQLTISKLQGNTLTITSPGTGQYLRYNGSAFVNSAISASDISSLFTLHASSGSDQTVNGGSTVNLLAGTNITATASATNTVTVATVNNPTFTGTVTASNSGGVALAVSGTPTAGTTTSLLQLGGAIASGNNAANGGTYLGINEPTSGAGSAADLVNIQRGGASILQITSAGASIFSGNLSVASTNTFTTGTGTVTLGSLTNGGNPGLVQASSTGVLTSSTINRDTSALLTGTLSVGNGGTGQTSFANTNGLLFAGTTTGGALQNLANGSSGTILQSNGTGSLPSWVTATAASTCSDCLVQNPLTNGRNTVQPTNNSIVSLTLQATSGTGSPDILDVRNSGGGTLLADFSSTGALVFPAANSVSTTSGALTVDSAAALNLGTSNATSVSVSKAGVTTTINGALTVTQATTLNGNTSVTGANTLTVGTGATSLGGDLSVTGTVNFKKGTDFSTTGTSNDVVFGSGSLIRLTGASTQTITGIAGGIDGRILTLVNAASQAATISNQNTGSTTAGDRIITGTGADLSLAPDTSIKLVYDITTARWRVVGGVGGTEATTVGSLNGGSANANGATISGNTLFLQSASATNPGLVDTANGQHFAGTKTFDALLTGSAGLTVTGGAVSLTGNAASSLTTSSGALTLTSNQAATWSTANGNLTLQAGSGTVSLGTSTTLTAGGALSVTSGGANSLTVDAGGAATLNLGTSSANAVSISKGGVTTTVNGALTSSQLLTASAGLTVTTSDVTITAGNLSTAGTVRLTNAGILQNITGYVQGSGTFAQTSATTTGDIHAITDTALAPAAAAAANLVNLTYTAGSTNASGNATTSGLTVTPTVNTSGAGTKAINGLNVVAPSITACTSGNCTVDGLKVATLASGAAANITSNGLDVQATGISAGSLTGLNVSSITGGAGSETAIAVGSGWDNVLSVGGTPVINGSGQLISSQLTGNLFNLGASSGTTSQNVLQGATVSVLAGSNITTTGSATDTVTVAIVNNPTFSGTVTDTNTTTGLALTGTLAASTTSSLLQLGPAIASGSSNGTYIGINTASASTADFLDFQNNGTKELVVSSSGNITFAGGGLTSNNAAITIDSGTSNSVSLGSADQLNLSGNLIQTGGNTISSGTGGYLINSGAATSGHFLRGNGTAYVDGILAGTDATGVFVQNIPAASSDNYVHPSANGVVSLTLQATSGTGTPNILNISTSGGSGGTILADFNSSGALVFPNANSVSTTAGDLTLQAGSNNISIAGTNPSITTTGTNTLTVDTGGAANLKLGTGNANAVSISKSGVTTTVNGALTVAGGQNLTLQSGAGQFSQTYTGTTTDAATITANSLTSGHFLNLSNTGSTYTGTAIFANLAASSGTFSGNFLDFQKAGTTEFKVDNAGTLYVQNNAGTTAACSAGQVITGANYYGGITSGGTCSSPSGFVTLQNAYDNSGSSNPSIVLNHTFSNGGFRIADDAGTPVTGNLFQVTSPGSSPSSIYLGVSSSGILTSGTLTVNGSGTSSVAGSFHSGNTGQFQIDTSGNTQTTGTLKVGTAGSQQFQVDASGNTTIVSSGTPNQKIQLNNDGTYVSTYKLSTTNSTAATYTIQNTAAGAGAVTVNGIALNLSGTATSGGTNTINALNFGAVTPIANNIFNGLLFGSGYDKLISSANFSVTGAGAVTAVGVNSGTGLVQGTGGLTVTGATSLSGGTINLNASSNNITNINTGSSTGAVNIGNSLAGALTLQSASTIGITTTNFNVDTTGNLTASGTLTENGTGVNTFAGQVLLNRNGTGSNDYTLALSGTPVAQATSAQLRLGNAIASGNNTASTGGTYIGINEPASGLGSTGDFLNFQNAGASELKVTSGGNVSANGTVSAGVVTSSTTISAGTGYQIGGAATTGHYLRGNAGGTAYVDSALQASDGVGAFLLKSPTANTDNTVTPSSGIVGLTVQGNGASDIIDFSVGSTKTDYFDSTGQLNMGAKILPTSNNSIDLGTSALNFQTGYFGTSVVSPLHQTLDTSTASTNSAGIILRSGNATGTTSNSGSVTIDSGTATGTAGNITIGNGAYAHNVTVGNLTAASQTILQAGTNGILMQTAATSTALQFQNANGINLVQVDSTTDSANLISNGSFEVNTTGWAAKAGTSATPTLTQITTQQYLGNGSMQVVTPGSGDPTNGGATWSRSFTNNTVYTFTLFAKASGSSFSTFQMGNSNNNATDTSCLTAQTVSTGFWTRFTCTFTYTGTTGTSYVYFKQTDNATNRTYYIDAVKLEAASSATPYREGVISLNGNINSPIVLRNQSDSTNAFQIQNSAGASLFNLDSTTGNVTVNGTLPDPATPTITHFSSGGSLANGDNYYRVAAINASGLSTEAVISNPTFGHGTGGNNDHNQVAWTTVANAANYKVYRSNDAGATWSVSQTLGSAITSIDDGNNTPCTSPCAAPTWTGGATPPSSNAAGDLITNGGSGVTLNATNGFGITLGASSVATASYGLRFPTAQGGINTVLLNDGTGNLSWTGTAGCSTCVATVPSTTAQNTVQPTANSVVSLTLRATSGTGTPDILDIQNSGGGTTLAKFDSTGLLTLNNGVTLATGGTFENDRASLFKALSLGDQTGTNVGASAAATVDVASSINITQTTAGKTLALFSPTNSTAGRIIYVSNTSATSISFTLTYGIGGTNSVVVAPGNTATLYWNGSVWTSAGIDGSGSNFIQNQTAVQTSANFNIQARASTVAATIQGAASQDIVDFLASGGGTAAKIDNVGNLTFGQATTISTSTGALTIAAGTNANLILNNNGTGNINIGTNASGNNTIQIGNTSGTNTQAILIGNNSGGINNVTIGSTTAGTTVLQAAGISETITGSTDVIKTNSNATNAFRIQNASTADLVNVDTSTTSNLVTNGDFESDGVTGWSARGSAGAPVQVSTQQWQGNSALSETTTAAANDGAKYAYTFTNTQQYTLSFYLKLSSGSWTFANLDAGRADNGSTDTSCSATLTPTTAPSTTAWTRYSCTFTAGAQSGTPYFYIKQLDATLRTFFIDGVQLQTGATATAFNAGGMVQISGIVNSPLNLQNKSDSTTAFMIQNSAGTTTLLSADTLNGRINVGNVAAINSTTPALVVTKAEIQTSLFAGNGSGGLTVSSASTNAYEPLLTGTARHPIAVVLAPEFAGAVLTGDGAGSNVGTMTSDFCSGSSHLNIPTSSNPCAATDDHNYYTWTTNQGSAQNYDIYVRYQLPSNFNGFAAGTSPITAYGWVTNTANDSLAISMYSGGTLCDSSATTINSSNTTWQSTALNGASGSPTSTFTGCSGLAAGNIVTFKIHMNAVSGEFTRVGEITVNYLSSY